MPNFTIIFFTLIIILLQILPLQSSSTTKTTKKWITTPSEFLSPLATTKEYEFIQWALNHGAKISNKLSWPVITNLGRSVVAKENMNKGELLFIIPKKMHVNLINAPKIMNMVLYQIPSKVFVNWYDDIFKIALLLVDVQSNGNNSVMLESIGPYVFTLPQDIPEAPDVNWSMEEMSHLQIQSDIDFYSQSKNRRHTVWKRFKQFFDDKGGHPWINQYQENYFKWACSMVVSRSFARYEPGGEKLTRSFIPIIDLMNHDPWLHSQFGIEMYNPTFNGSSIYRAIAKFKRGEEVKLNYAVHSNTALLQYGFAVHNNPDESVELPWEKEPQTENDDEEDMFELKWISTRVNTKNTVRDMMKELMNEIMLLVVRPRGNNNKKNSVTIANTLIALQTCMKRTRKKLNSLPTTLQQDLKMLNSGNSCIKSSRTLQAIEFRASKKRLWVALYGFCESIWMKEFKCSRTKNKLVPLFQWHKTVFEEFVRYFTAPPKEKIFLK
jgi:hypothetical protein